MGTPVHREAVKVDLVPEPAPAATIMEQNTRILTMHDTDASVVMEIMMCNSTIRFFNNTNSDLFRTTLQCLGGMSYAW